MAIGVAHLHAYFSIPDNSEAVSGSVNILAWNLTSRLGPEWVPHIYESRKCSNMVEGAVGPVRIVEFPEKMDLVLLKALRGRNKLLTNLGWDLTDRPVSSSELFYGSYSRRAAADIARRGIEVIHVYGYHNFLPKLRRANPHAGIILHAHDLVQVLWDRKLTKSQLRHADLIVGPSEYVTSRIITHWPEFASNCITIENSSTVSPPAEHVSKKGGDGRKNQLLWVGRVSPEKGLHLLIDAFNRLAETRNDLELKIVGPTHVHAPRSSFIRADNPEADAEVGHLFGDFDGYVAFLRDRMSEKARDRIQFVGKVPHKQLVHFYQEADIFVFTSVWPEAFGMPIVEAMQYALPVVSTPTGGAQGIVRSGVTGYLTGGYSAEELAMRVAELLDEPRLRAAFGGAGQQRAKEMYGWDRYVGQWDAAYRRVLARARPGRIST